MIIGFMGQKHSGKDTAGAYLVKEHGFERKAFADPGKKCLANIFDIPYYEIDKLKREPNLFMALGYKNEPTSYIDHVTADIVDIVRADHMWSPISELDFRKFLQRFMEEGHKEIFGKNVWVDLTLPLNKYYNDRKIVITDVRFEEEVERIHELDGFVIRIVRKPNAAALLDQDHHRSEQEQLILEHDLMIENNGTLEELYVDIEQALSLMLR